MCLIIYCKMCLIIYLIIYWYISNLTSGVKYACLAASDVTDDMRK